MSLDTYEEFTGGPNFPSRDRVHITINKNGVIYMNASCYRMLGKPEAVKFFFDKTRDRIAIKPAHARLAGVFPVKQMANHSFLLNAASFCQHYGIRLSTTEKFVLPDLDDQGILHLDLRNTVTVTTKRKTPRRK